MSKFVSYIGIMFAKYAPVEDWAGYDRIGTMTVDGAEVLSVTVNENRTVDVTVDTPHFNHFNFTREALHDGEVTMDEASGDFVWRVTPSNPVWHGGDVIIRFAKYTTMEVAKAIKDELYDYD